MRVSVVMVVYNGAWCIGRAIDSVLAQTIPAHELLVADDGSTDGTPSYVGERYGPPVRVLRMPHRNASATRHLGTLHATGDWLAFLDADDWWAPEKLERQLAFLKRHPELRWCSTDGELVSSEGVVRESWLADYFEPVRDLAGDLLPHMVERCFPLMSSMVVDRRAYEAAGGLDPAVHFSHDYDLWLRLAARWPGGVLAERLVRYWRGPTNLSRNIEGRYREDLMLMRRVAAGDLGHRPELQALAAERAAALEFDLAMVDLRAGRTGEARARLRRATARGPWRRRALAAGAALLPGGALARLARAPWIRRTVQETRRAPMRMALDGAPGGRP